VTLDCRKALDNYESYPATRGFPHFWTDYRTGMCAAAAQVLGERMEPGQGGRYWTLYESLLSSPS
jgi:hypothetical protein